MLDRPNTHRQTAAALNRLLTTLYRSLPMYLTDATPWTHTGDERIVETLGHIVADQKAACARIAKYLQDEQVPVELGDYPMSFTDLHDLSLDYLVSRLIRACQQDIAIIEDCACQVSGSPAAQRLVEEALGAARAHLESLGELAIKLAPSKPGSAKPAPAA